MYIIIWLSGESEISRSSLLSTSEVPIAIFCPILLHVSSVLTLHLSVVSPFLQHFLRGSTQHAIAKATMNTKHPTCCTVMKNGYAYFQ